MHFLLISMPGGAEWIMIILVLLGLTFLLRKVYMWYTGMIELLTENMKQTKLLEEIRDELKKAKA